MKKSFEVKIFHYRVSFHNCCVRLDYITPLLDNQGKLKFFVFRTFRRLSPSDFFIIQMKAKVTADS